MIHQISVVVNNNKDNKTNKQKNMQNISISNIFTNINSLMHIHDYTSNFIGIF